MQTKVKNKLKITDLKDMLRKTNEQYGEKIAYKIKLKDNSYVTYTHKQVRQRIDALRNSTNKTRIKKQKNCCYRRK